MGTYGPRRDPRDVRVGAARRRRHREHRPRAPRAHAVARRHRGGQGRDLRAGRDQHGRAERRRPRPGRAGRPARGAGQAGHPGVGARPDRRRRRRRPAEATATTMPRARSTCGSAASSGTASRPTDGPARQRGRRPRHRRGPRPPAGRRAPPPRLPPRSDHRQQVVTRADGRDRHRQHLLLEPGQRRDLARAARPPGRAAVPGSWWSRPAWSSWAASSSRRTGAVAVAADDVATDLVIVGETNRKALLAGAAHRDLAVHLAADPRAGRRVGAGQPPRRRRRAVRERPPRPLPLIGARTVARPAVIFGGPSPEHDISILTGLQAARALHDAGRDPWRSTGRRPASFHAVPATLEAKDYVTGVPRQGRARSTSLARPGGGFVGESRALRQAARARDRRRRQLLPRRPRRGRHPAGRARPRRRALHRSRRGRGRARHGQAGLRRGDGGGRPAVAAPARVFTADGPDPTFAGPYIVKPRFGGSSIGIEITDDLGHGPGARAARRPHFRDGAVVEPYLPGSVDLNVSVRTWPKLSVSAVEKPLRKDASGRIYTYAEKYLGGGEGLSSAPRELPARHPRRGGRAHPHAGRAGRARSPWSGARPASTSSGAATTSG